MRISAWLARGKFTLLSRSGSTSRTLNSKYLFWAEFSFHGVEIMPQTHVQEWSIVNSYRKLRAIRSESQNSNCTTTAPRDQAQIWSQPSLCINLQTFRSGRI